VKAESHSSSGLLAALLFGRERRGIVLGRRNLGFGAYSVTITEPGAPRLPNGIECGLAVRPGASVVIGRGRLLVGGVEVTPGEPWNASPAFDRLDVLPAGPEPVAGQLGPWLGARDAMRAGYIAGLVLLHGQVGRAEQLALHEAIATNPITATMLRHAALGEVPEPVHDLLAAHDVMPLLTWSAAGMAWLRGLISAGLPLDAAAVTPMPRAADRRRGIA
jgi:hypothetical protein